MTARHRSPDEILDLLATALRPEDAEPSEAERARLRREIRIRATARRSERRWWPVLGLRPIPAALVGSAVLAGAGAVAVSLGAPMPTPVRAVAHSIGLPVDSPELVATHRAIEHLEDALSGGDRHAVETSAGALRRRLDHLDADERHEVADHANALLQRARAMQEDHDGPMPADEHGPARPDGGTDPTTAPSEEHEPPPTQDPGGHGAGEPHPLDGTGGEPMTHAPESTPHGR